MSKLFARVGVPVLAVLALAGCGSSNNSNSSSSSTPTTSASGPGVNSAIAAQVPAALKSKGTLTVATEPQYAPIEFLAPDGKTMIGLDPDLMHAIGEVLGLKIELVNATFNTIIPGLSSGKYDLGASAFTDTKEREKVVDFVDYFRAGVSFYAKSAADPGVTSVADLCGKSAAAEKGTVEDEEITAQAAKCKNEGKPAVTSLTFPGQNAVNLSLASGRAEVAMADSPVAAYQVAQSKGALKLLGAAYGVAPYGFAIPKTSGLVKPVLAAVKLLVANGTYDKILSKWGLTSGALNAPKTNGAIG